MDHRKGLSPAVALLALLLAQTACSDSSGPGLVPSSIAANSATDQTASPGTEVAEPPSVIVRDQNGALLVGASVTFEVTAGGGSVTGSTIVTNGAGVATVGSWTLGSLEGPNRLVATSGSVSVTFNASSLDACIIGGTHVIGGTTTGELAVSDCQFGDGTFVDFYGAVLSAAGTYSFNETSSSFDAYLVLYDANGNLVGINDDFGASSDSRIRAILPPGNFVLGANSYDRSVGPYTLTSALDGQPVTNCENVFVVRGITTNQSLDATDCPRAGGYYADQYFIYVLGGQAVTVSMNAAAPLDAYLSIYDPNGALITSNDNKDATTKDAQIAFTPAITGFYGIQATSANAGATGAYTLVVQ
ncbi:MAG TPA: Ig-like domain-containing protein [Gemmatimonadaceae bacterium]|nr:Ig-like domain-containing protein [Gemmatimonadaceae bacterium]